MRRKHRAAKRNRRRMGRIRRLHMELIMRSSLEDWQPDGTHHDFFLLSRQSWLVSVRGLMLEHLRRHFYSTRVERSIISLQKWHIRAHGYKYWVNLPIPRLPPCIPISASSQWECIPGIEEDLS